MIHLLIRSKDKSLTYQASRHFANLLKKDLGSTRVLGPQEPLINKIRNKYLMDLFLKIEKKYSIESCKR